MDASSTVTSAFIAFATRGRMTPLKNAPLVTTNHATTSSTTSTAKTKPSLRSEPPRFLRTGVEEVSAINLDHNLGPWSGRSKLKVALVGFELFFP